MSFDKTSKISTDVQRCHGAFLLGLKANLASDLILVHDIGVALNNQEETVDVIQQYASFDHKCFTFCY